MFLALRTLALQYNFSAGTIRRLKPHIVRFVTEAKFERYATMPEVV